MQRLTLKVIERRIKTLQLKADKIKKRDKKPALREIARLMRTHDISIGELGRANGTGHGKRNGADRSKTAKVQPMYRDSKTGETWSGRGRTARWLAAAEKAGHKRKEFLIKQA